METYAGSLGKLGSIAPLPEDLRLLLPGMERRLKDKRRRVFRRPEAIRPDQLRIVFLQLHPEFAPDRPAGIFRVDIVPVLPIFIETVARRSGSGRMRIDVLPNLFQAPQDQDIMVRV